MEVQTLLEATQQGETGGQTTILISLVIAAPHNYGLSPYLPSPSFSNVIERFPVFVPNARPAHSFPKFAIACPPPYFFDHLLSVGESAPSFTSAKHDGMMPAPPMK